MAHLGVTCDSGRFVGYDYIYSVVVTKTKKEQSGKYEPFNDLKKGKRKSETFFPLVRDHADVMVTNKPDILPVLRL